MAPDLATVLIAAQLLVAVIGLVGMAKSYVNGTVRTVIDNLNDIPHLRDDVEDVKEVLVALGHATADEDKRVPPEEVHDTFNGGDRKRADEYIQDVQDEEIRS